MANSDAFCGGFFFFFSLNRSHAPPRRVAPTGGTEKPGAAEAQTDGDEVHIRAAVLQWFFFRTHILYWTASLAQRYTKVV